MLKVEDNTPEEDADLRVIELRRVLEAHKVAGEARRKAFNDKMTNIRERQEVLQQRKIARLSEEGIIIDLEEVRRKSREERKMIKEKEKDMLEKKRKLQSKLNSLFHNTGEMEEETKREESMNAGDGENVVSANEGDADNVLEQNPEGHNYKPKVIENRNYIDWWTNDREPTHIDKMTEAIENGEPYKREKDIAAKRLKRGKQTKSRINIFKALVKVGTSRQLVVKTPPGAESNEDIQPEEPVDNSQVEASVIKKKESAKDRRTPKEKVKRASAKISAINAFKPNNLSPRVWKANGKQKLQSFNSSSRKGSQRAFSKGNLLAESKTLLQSTRKS